MTRLTLIIVLITGILNVTLAQENTISPGQISGNLEVLAQYYTEDDEINAKVPDYKMGMNSFANILYSNGMFTAGIRFESYLNTLEGYPVGFDGSGIGYRYMGFRKENLEVTVGNFYEQFGSGMLLRTYEERTLGIDNALDGLRVKYTFNDGVNVKAIVGRQRASFDSRLIDGDGLIRGIDAEINFNNAFKKLSEKDLNVTIGASFVSKFNDQNTTTTFRLPENVGAYSLRLDLLYKNWRFGSEYTYKENDPYPSPSGQFYDPFNYLYKNGEGLLLNLGYSQKGFAIDLTAKHTDNMLWRSTNEATLGNSLLIGYIPSLTKQHTYNLASTLYPYVTNLYGEVAFKADVIYTFEKESSLGGKYGTTIDVSLTSAYAPERKYINDLTGERTGYTTSLLSASDSLFARDFNVRIKKKISKKVKLNLSYFNFEFDDRVQLVAVNHEVIKANIIVADVSWKVAPNHQLRFETQGLWTEQDQGNWAFGQIEYSFSPHLYVAVLDQYNYGNDIKSERFHYALVNVGYANNANRFSLQYGRQRAGWFCVGGVCRAVPASNGITFTLSSSF